MSEPRNPLVPLFMALSVMLLSPKSLAFSSVLATPVDNPTAEHPSVLSKSRRFREQLDGRPQIPSHTWPLPATTSGTVTSQHFSLQASTDTIAIEPLIQPGARASEARLQFQRHDPLTHMNLVLNIGNGDALDPEFGDQQLSLDGTSVGIDYRNWRFSAGAVDRWWGPAWQSPLILSTNARPLPALSLDRIQADPFQHWGFSWLGPWRLSTFLGQLEQDRVIANALIWGLRIAAMPVQGLELGLSRTALFGGDNRPVDGKVLFDVILGRDNDANQPGNQLGAVDISYKFGHSSGLHQWGQEFYIEVAGEDEANGFPAKKFAVLGLTGFMSDDASSAWHYLLEYADTTAGSLGDHDIPGVSYEHHIYGSGYTHRGQVIGSPLTGDTVSFTLGLWMDHGSLNHTQGAWLSRKAFESQSELHQISYWRGFTFGPFQCQAVVSVFDRLTKGLGPDQTGDRWSGNLSASWRF